jgi:NadR type nicotinamide-nucleotide adenylyltransferase
MNNQSVYRIVLTGPESTGKSILSEKLANHFKTEFIPEYARTYIENLNRPYEYDDLLKIASQQVVDVLHYEAMSDKYLFLDTWLHITKIWFMEVYGSYPPWIDDNIDAIPIDLYLLCYPDMPWEPDPVRENEDKREYLFQLYLKEIENTGIPYHIIKGLNDERTNNAIDIIEDFFS